MVRKEVTVRTGAVLEAMSAAEFIQLASKYSSGIWLERGEKRANAKSLLGMLALGLSAGVEVRLVAEGDDEDEAIAELGDFLALRI